MLPSSVQLASVETTASESTDLVDKDESGVGSFFYFDVTSVGQEAHRTNDSVATQQSPRSRGDPFHALFAGKACVACRGKHDAAFHRRLTCLIQELSVLACLTFRNGARFDSVSCLRNALLSSNTSLLPPCVWSDIGISSYVDFCLYYMLIALKSGFALLPNDFVAAGSVTQPGQTRRPSVPAGAPHSAWFMRLLPTLKRCAQREAPPKIHLLEAMASRPSIHKVSVTGTPRVSSTQVTPSGSVNPRPPAPKQQPCLRGVAKAPPAPARPGGTAARKRVVLQRILHLAVQRVPVDEHPSAPLPPRAAVSRSDSAPEDHTVSTTKKPLLLASSPVRGVQTPILCRKIRTSGRRQPQTGGTRGTDAYHRVQTKRLYQALRTEPHAGVSCCYATAPRKHLKDAGSAAQRGSSCMTGAAVIRAPRVSVVAPLTASTRVVRRTICKQTAVPPRALSQEKTRNSALQEHKAGAMSGDQEKTKKPSEKRRRVVGRRGKRR